VETSAASVEPAPSSGWGETMESTTAAHSCAASESTIESRSATAVKGRPATIKSWPAAIESATAIEAMEPRPRTNKHAAGKIIRPVVAVGRAGIRGIPVVTVGTDRSRPNVAWCNVARPASKSDSNPDLRVRGARHYHAKPEQHCIF